MSKRIRSSQSARIDRTNALPENNIGPAPSVPMESKAAGTGEVTETCTVTIAAPSKPWEYLSRLYTAYGSYHDCHNQPKPVTQPVRQGNSNTPANTGSVQRYSWNGFAATAILRWMGANGIKAKAAGNALVRLGVEGVSGATVQTQIQAGRKPDAKLPPLTEEQQNAIKAAAA